MKQVLNPLAEYVPAGHSRHVLDDVPAVVVEYSPAGQYKHCAASAGDHEPLGHALHDGTEAATDSTKPAAQPAHALDVDAPVVVEYRPAPHAVHEAEAPTAQLPYPHRVQVDAPARAEYEPALHVKQALAAVAPTAVANRPASHSRHVAAAALKYDPAVHGVQVEKSLTAKVPNAHGRHVATDVAPVAVEYVPAVQLAQLTAPVPLNHEPAAHAEHVYEAKYAVKEPGWHAVHTVLEVAAKAAEYVPGTHEAQKSDAMLLQVPGGQDVHADVPAAEKCPAPHIRHVALAVAATAVE